METRFTYNGGEESAVRVAPTGATRCKVRATAGNAPMCERIRRKEGKA